MTKDLDFARQAFVNPATYERGRSGYADAAVDRLVHELGVNDGSLVLDVAAGTGKLSRMLATRAAAVVAVEPVAAMREQLSQVEGVRAVGAVAESLPFEAGSVDAVTVAQAFHWFRPEVALPELHRVLRPGGALGLIWNQADLSVPWVERVAAMRSVGPSSGPMGTSKQAVKRFLAPARQRVRRDRGASGAGREDPSWLVKTRAGFALPVAARLFSTLKRATLRHEEEMNVDRLVDWALSFSNVARLTPTGRDGVARRVRALAEHELPERFAFPFVTEVFWCDRREVMDP